MNRPAKLTGVELKAVLEQVVGGIYLKRSFDFVTNIFTKFHVTDKGLELMFDDYIKISIPIADDDEFINYAVACINEDEEWEDNAYFSHNVEVQGYDLLFNIKDIPTELTIPQLKALINEEHGRYSVDSQDGNSVSMNLINANISIDDNEICFYPLGQNVNIQMEDIEQIVNESEEMGNIHLRIELNNGMSDLEIEPSYGERGLMQHSYREVK
ncbi:MAG: hypothetical protein PHW34_14040 [Hespellia sp.]|nr:hypothetical protein [Hespellia sp.]